MIFYIEQRKEIAAELIDPDNHRHPSQQQFRDALEKLTVSVNLLIWFCKIERQKNK